MSRLPSPFPNPLEHKMDGICTSRRKACDLCVSRKIKCDSLKPTCTNCRLYGAECKITAVAANPSSAKRRAQIRSSSVVSPAQSGRVDALEARLANIESLLEKQVSAQTWTPETSASQNAVIASAPNSACISASPGSHGSTENLELPPLTDVLPLVDNYFKNYNKMTPIFEESSFMRMLLDLYSSSSRPPVVLWAAVNVVLAIHYHILQGLAMEDPRVSTYHQNVQSAMADLMLWQEDLLGLQVMLGMAIVSQGCINPQLSIVMMGSAVRIAQRMRLHSKQALLGLPKAVALHRQRLFWITYILDRDLALRAHSHYMQLDNETDLEIPEENPEDGLGIIWLANHNVPFNYLRTRVQLAFIQGKVHDITYSQRGKSLNQQQRQVQISRIESMLYDWQKQIPDEFQHAENVRQFLDPMPAQVMTNLFFRHIESLFRVHSVFSFDDSWISRVIRYLSPAVIELRDDVDGEVVRSELTPLPTGWAECVRYCRRCLALLLSRNCDYSIWLHACGTFSSLIVITVNMIEFPDNPSVAEDAELIDAYHGLFSEMGLRRSPEHMEMFNVLEQLNRRARGQVKRIAQGGGALTDLSGLVDEELFAQIDWTAPVNMDMQ